MSSAKALDKPRAELLLKLGRRLLDRFLIEPIELHLKIEYNMLSIDFIVLHMLVELCHIR